MMQNTDTSLKDRNLLGFLREALSSTSLKVKAKAFKFLERMIYQCFIGALLTSFLFLLYREKGVHETIGESLQAE